MNDQIAALKKLQGQIQDHFLASRENLYDQELSILGLIEGMMDDIKYEINERLEKSEVK